MSDYPEIAERFARETATHIAEVLHDDGLYRHIRCRRPNSSVYQFDVVTWPGSLAIRGDLNRSYVFTRTPDMFEFFRSAIWEDSTVHINPSYWAEKTAEGQDGFKSYSEDVFKQQAADALAEAEKRLPGVTQAWNAFIDPDRGAYNTEYADEAVSALNQFTFKDFAFSDVWEWDLRDYDWSFLWACHAIVWGIQQYDAAKAAEKPEPRRVDVLRVAVAQEGGDWTTARAVDLFGGAITTHRARALLNQLAYEGLLVKHGKIGRLWTPATVEAAR